MSQQKERHEAKPKKSLRPKQIFLKKATNVLFAAKVISLKVKPLSVAPSGKMAVLTVSRSNNHI